MVPVEAVIPAVEVEVGVGVGVVAIVDQTHRHSREFVKLYDIRYTAIRLPTDLTLEFVMPLRINITELSTKTPKNRAQTLVRVGAETSDHQ